MKWIAGAIVVGSIIIAATLAVALTRSPVERVESSPEPASSSAEVTEEPEPTDSDGRLVSPAEGWQGADYHSTFGCSDQDELGIRPLVHVTRVIDGDTLEVQSCNRKRTFDVRLIGIDSPETVHPTEPVECYWPEASEFTEQIEGDLVRLVFDAERIDPYGRTLAYVITPSGDLFNEVLVRWGYATVTIYPPNDLHEADLRRAEERARDAGRGLWGAC